MPDYISRETAIAVVERYFTELLELNPDICLDGIKSIPAADVVEVRHGRWNRIDHNALSCNKCGSTFIVLQGYEKMRHCPYCWAKMDGGQEE